MGGAAGGVGLGVEIDEDDAGGVGFGEVEGGAVLVGECEGWRGGAGLEGFGGPEDWGEAKHEAEGGKKDGNFHSVAGKMRQVYGPAMKKWKFWLVLSAVLGMAVVVGGRQPWAGFEADWGFLDALALPGGRGLWNEVSLVVARWVCGWGGPEAAAAAWPWVLVVRDGVVVAAGVMVAWILGWRMPRWRGAVVVAAAGVVVWLGAEMGVGRLVLGGQRGWEVTRPALSFWLKDAVDWARERADGREVWCNASARRWLGLWPGSAGGLGVGGSGEARGSRGSGSGASQRGDSWQWGDWHRLAGDPVLWRRAISGERPGAVVLAGPREEFRPLLWHLLESPDWVLARVTPGAFVFLPSGWGLVGTRMDSGVWPEAAPEGLTGGQRGVFWARMGAQAAAAREYGLARRYFDRAVEAAPQHPLALVMRASFFAERGDWLEAAHDARRLVRERPNFVAAWKVLAQAELALGGRAAAFDAARRLMELAPQDTQALFVAARCFSEANAPEYELEALGRLIALSRRRGLPVGNYELYLGQALARRGFREQAAEALRRALESGELTGEGRQRARELLEDWGGGGDQEQQAER